MPSFVYKAKAGPHDVTSGILQADNVQQAIAKIVQAGQTPIEVKLQDNTAPAAVQANRRPVPAEGSPKPVKSVKVPLPVISIFTRQMYDMLDAGVALSRSLEVIANQKQHPALKQIVEQMRGFVQEGGSLSAALAQHPAVFPPLYVNMVKSGEASGHLPEVLNRLAQFTEKDLEMQGKVKGSLMYPLIILVIGILTMFVMLTFVLPRMTAMFDDFDAALPWPTQLVVSLSSFCARFWWLIILVTGGIVFYCKQVLATPAGRLWLDQTALKMPILNQFIQQAEMARFARTMGTLLESGLTIPAALESVTAIIENIPLKEEMKEVLIKVKAGTSLTSALKASPLFPEMAINLIAVGEESGKLERGLYKLANTCERGTQETAEAFTTILGPAVLVIVVGIVGFMIVAMLLPMFKMNMIIN